jgi:uncharacterized membrane protein YfcA
LILLTGVYGGYFGAAQGVLLLAVMGIGIGDDLQRLNAVKNVLAMLVNAVAGVIFIASADVDWRVVALIAGGSVVGGLAGARVGRALPPVAFRSFVVIVGVVAIRRPRALTAESYWAWLTLLMLKSATRTAGVAVRGK